MVAEVIAPMVLSALVQAFQAWLAMAKVSGMSDEQIDDLLYVQYDIFQKKVTAPLPDPDKENG